MHPALITRTTRIVALILAALTAVLVALAAPARAAAVTNPDFPPACGTKVIMVLDESGSIDSTAGAEAAVRSAANAFATGLADTGSQLAVIEFGTSAKRVFNYTNVTSGAGGTLATTFQPYFNGTAVAPADVYNSPSQTGQWTNWQDALEEVKLLNTASGVAPLVVFITDGDPTATGLTAPFSTNVANATALAAAIPQADAVKAQGSHILAVGVGAALNNATSLGRLSAISGPDTATTAAALNLGTTDVLAIADFANLPNALRAVVNQLCHRSIAITKSVDKPVVLAGTQVTYTIRVTNDGAIALSNVAVTDPITPACAKTIGALAPGAFSEYTCTATIGQDTTNVATVNATDPNGVSLPPKSDDAVVDVIAPALTLAKSVDKATVIAPATVTWTITVENTGDVALTNVTVADPNAPGCATVIGTLAAHTAATPITCTATITQATTNTATVTGIDPLGRTIDPGPKSATVNVIAPGLSVVKSVDTGIARSGDTVTWTIVVTNTGNVDLTNVAVSDAVEPTCNTTIGTLAANTTATPITCTTVVGANDLTNVAVATGVDPLQNTLTASDDAVVDVINPSFDVVKTVTPGTVLANTTVTWKVSVTNTGDVPLSNVIVDDPIAPGCATTIAAIAVGATESVSCDTVVVVDTENVATVTADYATTVGATPVPRAGPPAPGFARLPAKVAKAVVDVIAPNLNLVKTVDKASVPAGTAVVFTLTLTNNGDQTINNIVLSDPLAPGCSKPIGSLASGATTSVTCTQVITATITNVATVTGTDPLLNNLTRTAQAKVTVVPAIVISGTSQTTMRIDKRGPATAKAGQVITYRIKITNTGTVAAENVVMRDPLPNGMALAAKSEAVQLVKGVVTVTVGTLQPGASKTLLIKVRIDRTASGKRNNVATASASNATTVRDNARIKIIKIAGQVNIPKVTG